MSWLSWILAYLFDCVHPHTTFIVWTPYCTYMRRGGAGMRKSAAYVVSSLLFVLPAFKPVPLHQDRSEVMYSRRARTENLPLCLGWIF